MAGTLEQQKKKINTIGNIHKITKTMESVATSKMKKSIGNALATREYAKLSLGLLHALSKEAHLTHPLLKINPDSNKKLIIFISSNKGLCGNYNVSLARSLWKYISGKKGVTFDVVAIGKYAEKSSKKLGLNVIASFNEISDYPEIDDIGGVSTLLFDEFLSGKYRKVVIVYAHFASALSFEPVARELLPITEKIITNIVKEISEFKVSDKKASIGPKVSATYTFEPNEESVLEYVLDKLVSMIVYQAVLESNASEQSSRRTAMKSASDNAKSMSEDLKLAYNRSRQAVITQEISEISAGVESTK
jgi:F-type H+-transporting ATPase subunit gamma